MDVDFTAGTPLPKGTARKRPGERRSKQVAFKFQSSEAKAPASNASNTNSPAIQPTPRITATVDVKQLETEVRGVIST